jgi:uncharacterized protein YnzC (UPF0291/DUF896 family)
MIQAKTLNQFLKEGDQPLTEDLASFYSKLRQHYYSGKLYTFKNWIKEVEVLLDELS